MPLTDRELLCLHVEAVWSVKLPPILHTDMELLPEGSQPPWKLYIAEMASGRVRIWRPDVDRAERPLLLARLNEALAPSITEAAPAGIRREVALHLAAQPTLALTEACSVTQPLSSQEYNLLEAFQSGSAEYYLSMERGPLFGVIVDGLLLSIAHSSRRTSKACELGIDTLPEARRRGYALAATGLWTAAVADEGLVPLYSASAENIASLRLAATAGYRVFAREVMLGG